MILSDLNYFLNDPRIPAQLIKESLLLEHIQALTKFDIKIEKCDLPQGRRRRGGQGGGGHVPPHFQKWGGGTSGFVPPPPLLGRANVLISLFAHIL